MTATLQEWLDKGDTPEPLTVADETGAEVRIEFRHPSRAATEGVFRLMGGEVYDVGQVKTVLFAAIEACVVGATEENIPRISALGGEDLERRLYDLIGLPAPQAADDEAQEVGNSHSGTT